LKGIAIGLSNNSKEILKRLKKTEFVKDIETATEIFKDKLGMSRQYFHILLVNILFL